MPIPNEVYTIISKHLSRQPMDAQEQARLHDWQKANPKAFEELSKHTGSRTPAGQLSNGPRYSKNSTSALMPWRPKVDNSPRRDSA